MISPAELEEWRRIRLPNWGRATWADLMADAPDSSCANPIYDNFIWSDAGDGYGEVTAETVVVLQSAPARAEMEPVDREDAEVVGFMVAQLPARQRSILSRRYVLRERVDRDHLEAAIYAVLMLRQENRRVVARMSVV